MKPSHTLLAIAVALSGSGCSPPHEAPGEDSIEREIIEHERRVWDALSSNDSAAFTELVAPEALMVSVGARYSGAEYSAYVWQHEGIEVILEDIKVVVLGENAGLVNYRAMAPDGSGGLWVTTVWVKRAGRWVSVFNQDSPIQQ
jgi:hypothetical protein